MVYGLIVRGGALGGGCKRAQDARERSNEAILIHRFGQRNRKDRTICAWIERH